MPQVQQRAQRLTQEGQPIAEHHGRAQVVDEIQIGKAASLAVIPEEPETQARRSERGPRPAGPGQLPRRSPPVRHQRGEGGIFGSNAPRQGGAQAVVADSFHGQDLTDAADFAGEREKANQSARTQATPFQVLLGWQRTPTSPGPPQPAPRAPTRPVSRPGSSGWERPPPDRQQF